MPNDSQLTVLQNIKTAGFKVQEDTVLSALHALAEKVQEKSIEFIFGGELVNYFVLIAQLLPFADRRDFDFVTATFFSELLNSAIQSVLFNGEVGASSEEAKIFIQSVSAWLAKLSEPFYHFERIVFGGSEKIIGMPLREVDLDYALSTPFFEDLVFLLDHLKPKSPSIRHYLYETLIRNLITEMRTQPYHPYFQGLLHQISIHVHDMPFAKNALRQFDYDMLCRLTHNNFRNDNTATQVQCRLWFDFLIENNTALDEESINLALEARIISSDYVLEHLDVIQLQDPSVLLENCLLNEVVNCCSGEDHHLEWVLTTLHQHLQGFQDAFPRTMPDVLISEIRQFAGLQSLDMIIKQALARALDPQFPLTVNTMKCIEILLQQLDGVNPSCFTSLFIEATNNVSPNQRSDLLEEIIIHNQQRAYTSLRVCLHDDKSALIKHSETSIKHIINIDDPDFYQRALIDYLTDQADNPNLAHNLEAAAQMPDPKRKSGLELAETLYNVYKGTAAEIDWNKRITIETWRGKYELTLADYVKNMKDPNKLHAICSANNSTELTAALGRHRSTFFCIPVGFGKTTGTKVYEALMHPTN